MECKPPCHGYPEKDGRPFCLTHMPCSPDTERPDGAPNSAPASIPSGCEWPSLLRAVLSFDLLSLDLLSVAAPKRKEQLAPRSIAMPDISTIEAVLSAEQSTYLYFVADPSKPGYHLFAKNLRQHNRNKQLYINWINKQKIYR